jgi:ParB family chromosome partitioning protein
MALKNRFERIARGEGPRPLGFRPAADDGLRFLFVHPDQIERDPEQPRKNLGSLDGLKSSIAAQGILQPLIVSPLTENRYRLIAGERRWTAARALGLTEAPVIVRTVEDQQRLTLQIIENLHRKDLDPLEEARSYRRLMEEFSLGQRDIAAKLGKSLAQVNETLRILDLPEAILRDVRTSEHGVSKSVLLEIAKGADARDQAALWRRAQAGKLTVKEAREAKTGARAKPAGKTTASGQPRGAAWSARVGGGATVRVVFAGGGGKGRGTTLLPAVRAALEEALGSLGSGE